MEIKLKYQSPLVIRAEIMWVFLSKHFKTRVKHMTPDFLSTGNKMHSNIYHPLLLLCFGKGFQSLNMTIWKYVSS